MKEEPLNCTFHLISGWMMVMQDVDRPNHLNRLHQLEDFFLYIDDDVISVVAQTLVGNGAK